MRTFIRSLLMVLLVACEGKATTKTSEPAPPKVAPAPPTFGVSPCKTDDDCILINMSPCDGCGCRETPILKAEEARADSYLASIKCTPNEKNAIVDCKCPSVDAHCTNGACVAQ